MPERLIELWEDVRWGLRRAVDRLRGGPTAPLTHSQVIRRRRAAALIVLVLGIYAVYRFVAVPGIPCDVSPAKTCIPADDAIALVPADADAYLHMNLDRESDQFETGLEVAGRLPHFEQIAQGVFSRLGFAPGTQLGELGSWVGDEAALAFVGQGSEPLALLEIDDEKGADRFVAELGQGQARRVPNGNDPFRAYRGGPAFVQKDGFLVLGTTPDRAGGARRGRQPEAQPRGLARPPMRPATRFPTCGSPTSI